MSDEHHTHDTHHDRDDARFDDETNTRPKGNNYIDTDLSDDGLDRRGFLRCMAWAGTATVWAMPTSLPAGPAITSACNTRYTMLPACSTPALTPLVLLWATAGTAAF